MTVSLILLSKIRLTVLFYLTNLISITMTFYLLKVVKRGERKTLFNSFDSPKAVVAESLNDFRKQVTSKYGDDVLLTYSESPEWDNV